MKTLFTTLIILSGTAFLVWNLGGFDLVAPSSEESLAESQIVQDFGWPPRLNEPYPDLHLVDQTGSPTRLSDFKGRIILVEPIGIPCAACQAFCGGHAVGGFNGIEPQPGLPSMRDAAEQYGQFDLTDDRLVKVYLLLYGMDMHAPTPDDARAWAEHFGLDRSKNEVVLTGLSSMMGDASFAMIPGLQLIDQDFIFCVDSTGRSKQKHDLYRDLLPRVRELCSRITRTN